MLTVEILHPSNNVHDGRWVKHLMPSGWAELTAGQLPLIALWDVTVRDPQLRRLEAFRILAGISAKDMARLYMQDLIGTRETQDETGKTITLTEVLPQLHWLDTEPAYDRSLLPEVNVKKQTWDGPGDFLNNFSVQRWGMCDELLNRFNQCFTMEDGEARMAAATAALHEALGAMYCPRGEKWVLATCDERGEQLKALPYRMKLAALFNYKALRATLPPRYPHCFDGVSGSKFGVHGMIVDLAGTIAFATVERAEQAPLHDVLVHCEQSLERTAEMKRKTPA